MKKELVVAAFIWLAITETPKASCVEPGFAKAVEVVFTKVPAWTGTVAVAAIIGDEPTSIAGMTRCVDDPFAGD